MQQILAPQALTERVHTGRVVSGFTDSAALHLDGWRLVSNRDERTVWFRDGVAVVPRETGD
jgi:hypothetical protein